MTALILYTLITAVFLRHKCQQFYVSDKIINSSDNEVLLTVKLVQFCVLYFLFLHFSFIFEKCQLMVMLSFLILLPLIVLDNLLDYSTLQVD